MSSHEQRCREALISHSIRIRAAPFFTPSRLSPRGGCQTPLRQRVLPKKEYFAYTAIYRVFEFSPPLELSDTRRHTYFVSLISWEAPSHVIPAELPSETGTRLRPSVQDPVCAPCRVFVFLTLPLD